MIKTNRDLADLVTITIDNSGYKKIWIAEQLGITRQGLTKLMNKQNFSLDDANKILSIIGYELVSDIDVIKKVCVNE